MCSLPNAALAFAILVLISSSITTFWGSILPTYVYLFTTFSLTYTIQPGLQHNLYNDAYVLYRVAIDQQKTKMEIRWRLHASEHDETGAAQLRKPAIHVYGILTHRLIATTLYYNLCLHKNDSFYHQTQQKS